MSLAVVGGAVQDGVGAVVAVLVLATVIWALGWLHGDAPSAPSTSDLVGSTLGVRAAGTAAVIQLVAYALLGVAAARTVGVHVLWGQPDLIAAVSGWWWPAWSVVALVITGALVSWLPTRAVATLVAALAAGGLLVYFYIALAVLAKVLAGTAPVEIGTSAWTSVLTGGTTIIFLGLAAVGFELPTTAGNRLHSVAAPLGWALGAAGALAALTLLATNLGATGGFRLDAADLSLIVLEMFGDSGVHWMIAGAAAVATAALLALTWAVLRVARRLTGVGAPTTVVTIAVLAFLTVALCRNWAGAADKLMHVAAMLLIVLYVFVAEANSRLSGAETATGTVRVLWPVVLAAVVLIANSPARRRVCATEALWPVAITAAVVGAAAALSAAAARPAPPPPPLH